MSKSSSSQVQYFLSYRRMGRGAWVPSVPMYDRRAVKRLENTYVTLYGEENVKVEIMEKAKRFDRKIKEDSESDDYHRANVDE